VLSRPLAAILHLVDRIGGGERVEGYTIGMNTTTILSLALAGAPEPPITPFTVDTVDVDHSGDSTQITAYGPDGEVAGEVVLWVDADGHVRIDATFADGLYLSVATDGETSSIDSEHGEAAAARVAQIHAALPNTELPEWVPCAGSVALAAYSCGHFNFITCGPSAFVAACECIELGTGGENSCW
jgi:hypothetical protein